MEIADRLLVLGDGQIIEDGSAQGLLTSDGHYPQLHEAWRDSLSEVRQLYYRSTHSQPRPCIVLLLARPD